KPAAIAIEPYSFMRLDNRHHVADHCDVVLSPHRRDLDLEPAVADRPVAGQAGDHIIARADPHDRENRNGVRHASTPQIDESLTCSLATEVPRHVDRRLGIAVAAQRSFDPVMERADLPRVLRKAERYG